jgi:hypothetical protein
MLTNQTMDLKIINPNASMLHQALGISDERADEISEHLNKLMESIRGIGEVPLCTCMQSIAELCSNNEELVYAVFTNARWMEKNSDIELIYRLTQQS